MKKNAINLNSWMIGIVVTACAAPTAALNIWPRIETMLSKGVSGNEIGIVILVTMSALGMASVPFAMRKADNKGFWTLCLVCGLSLAIVNYLMAVGAIGKVRDAHATEQAKAIYRHQALEAQLKELETSRGSVEPKLVSPAQLRTAEEAVRLAIAARDQECGRVGDYCRARVAQLAARQEELGRLESEAAAYARDEGLRRRVDALRSELLTAGPAPIHIDAQASRIATVLGLGGTASEIERVANWIINLLAITAEGFALLMPRIIVTALAGGASNGDQSRLSSISPVSISESEPRKFLVPKVAGKAARAIEGPPLPAVNVPLTVSSWLKTRTQSKEGRIKTWDAYVDYKRWAGPKAVTFTQFSFEMENLKVSCEKVSNRSFYKDIALVT